MAELDRQKEKVTFWRNLFFFILASVFGLVAFLFNSYEKLVFVKIVLIDITLLGLVILLILVIIKMNKEIDKLKDLWWQV